MHLTAIRVVGVGPFADLTFRFGEPGEKPRAVTVVLGGAGVGKTSLLGAVASTRPGHSVVLLRPGQATTQPPYAIAEWILGADDAARPHPLRVVTPNAPAAEGGGTGPTDDPLVVARRREQALFDRRATEGGFVLVALSAARWFSRAPLLLSSPERTLARYDVRAAVSFDDATRADLSRETKQVLAYAGISAALGGPRSLDAALRPAVDALLKPAGYTYTGVDARTLEPMFQRGGVAASFDELPTGVRHLVAMAALPTRALFAAYPDLDDPRQGEGVVLIDDVERQLDPPAQRALVPALRQALPRVQWIATTASPLVAATCEASEVLALRRLDAAEQVELFDGELARLH